MVTSFTDPMGKYNGWLKQTNGKLVFVEEWGVNRNNYDARSELPTNTRDMNNAGFPWVYWQILLRRSATLAIATPSDYLLTVVLILLGKPRLPVMHRASRIGQEPSTRRQCRQISRRAHSFTCLRFQYQYMLYLDIQHEIISIAKIERDCKL